MSIRHANKSSVVGFDRRQLARTEMLLAEYIERRRIAGAVSLVAHRGEVVQWLALGASDLESGTPIKPDTIFRIFSLTKPVTSAAAMMLVERGHISLDDPIEEFIPAFRDVKVLANDPATARIRARVGEQPVDMHVEPPRRKPTVWHLLTHTSGIGGVLMPPGTPIASAYRQARIGHDGQTLEETADKLAGIPLLFHPGEQWRYGVSTDMLARVIEVASGMTFGDFLRKHLFEPLGMRDTGFTVPQEQLHRLATLYSTVPSGELKPFDRGAFQAAVSASASRPAAGPPSTSASTPGPSSTYASAPGPSHTSASTPGPPSTSASAPGPSHTSASAPRPTSLLSSTPPSSRSTPSSGAPGTPASRYATPRPLQSGSAGLVSTVDDYFRFAQMLLDGGAWQGEHLLRPETVALMTQNHLPESLLPYRMPWPHVARYTRGCGFGLGVRVVLDPDEWGLPGSVGEYGWAGAANTFLWIDPVEQMVLLLFTQTFPFLHTEIDSEFKRLVYEAAQR